MKNHKGTIILYSLPKRKEKVKVQLTNMLSISKLKRESSERISAENLYITAFPLFFNFSTLINFSYYFMIMLLFGVLGVLVNTPIGVMMQLSVEEEYRGRVFGIVEMMSMAMIPAGTLLYGFLYDVLPAEWILIVSGATLIICVLFLLRSSVTKSPFSFVKRSVHQYDSPLWNSLVISSVGT